MIKRQGNKPNPMGSYKLTVKADLDIDDIWEYTNSQWGENQASKYLSQLEERFIALAENPNIGKQRYELTESPMSYHCGRHVIFYRKARKGIEVRRVLHDSMDFPRHFK